MEARAARFDEEDQLKKLRTQVKNHRENTPFTYLFAVESSRKKRQVECFERRKQFQQLQQYKFQSKRTSLLGNVSGIRND